MHVLIIGGSPHHPGGVEAFCDRSEEALNARVDWTITRLQAETAYMTLRRLPVLFRSLMTLLTHWDLKPDCVWLQYSNVVDLIYLAVSKLFGWRVMVTPHLGSNWRSQSNNWLRTLSGVALLLADRLALISRTQELELNLPARVPRSDIRNFLPQRVLTSSCSVGGEAVGCMQLIHSGRLSEGKGTFLFVEVCARLKAAGVPFYARITGGADEATRARLNSDITRYSLANSIAVLGRVSDAELLDLLHASDFLIHLSRIDSYPLIVLEAMACAALPVCMELAGARNMVESYDGQVVSIEGAVSETAEFLARQDLGESRRRGLVVATHVRTDYAWDCCAGALESALSACVGQTRGTAPVAETVETRT